MACGFTPRGYAVVLQDLRGRYRSEGFGEYFHTANVREGVDGFDTIEWIVAKPWSNPDVWKMIVDAMEHMRDLVMAMPFKPGETPLRVVPNLEKTLFDYYFRGAYDEWWAQDCNDFSAHFARHADIPGTYSGGWFDPFAIATTTYFTAMSKQNSAPQRLIMGPWTHMGSRNTLSWAGEVDFGPDSVWGFPKVNPDQERWFDRWLKGVSNGVEQEPPVRIFVMGGGNGQRNAEGRLNHGGRWRSRQLLGRVQVIA